MKKTRDEFSPIQILVSLIVLTAFIFTYMAWGLKIWEGEPDPEPAFESLLVEQTVYKIAE